MIIIIIIIMINCLRFPLRFLLKALNIFVGFDTYVELNVSDFQLNFHIICRLSTFVACAGVAFARRAVRTNNKTRFTFRSHFGSSSWLEHATTSSVSDERGYTEAAHADIQSEWRPSSISGSRYRRRAVHIPTPYGSWHTVGNGPLDQDPAGSRARWQRLRTLDGFQTEDGGFL